MVYAKIVIASTKRMRRSPPIFRTAVLLLPGVSGVGAVGVVVAVG